MVTLIPHRTFLVHFGRTPCDPWFVFLRCKPVCLLVKIADPFYSFVDRNPRFMLLILNLAVTCRNVSRALHLVDIGCLHHRKHFTQASSVFFFFDHLMLLILIYRHRKQPYNRRL